MFALFAVIAIIFVAILGAADREDRRHAGPERSPTPTPRPTSDSRSARARAPVRRRQARPRRLLARRLRRRGLARGRVHRDVFTMLIGVTLGLIAGYRRGWVDAFMARAAWTSCWRSRCSSWRSASASPARAPRAASTASIQPGLNVVIVVIVIASWPYIARLVRGQVLSLREKEFVEAARSLGASDRRIIFREILPEPRRADDRLRDDPDTPEHPLRGRALVPRGRHRSAEKASWGAMISSATSIFRQAWWYMTFPGLALLVTVLAFNLAGRRAPGRPEPA